MKTTPNDSCLSGPILKMLWCFPLSPLWIATNRQQKQHLTSNPNPPTPQTHHLAATYHQGHHLHQPTFHHDHPSSPNGGHDCQRPGAKRTKRRRSCRTSCGSSSKSRSSRRRWPRCRWRLPLVTFDGDVRRFGCSTGVVGDIGGALRKMLGKGGKEGNLTRKVGVCL